MSIFSKRIKQELVEIDQLATTTNGKVKIKSTSGNPVNNIIVELNYPTAGSTNYPAQVQQTTTVEIQLLSRYPLVEPKAKITTPIYHPNVYSSGEICFGTKWLPTHGLDLLIKRIIQIITFDAIILNAESPANGYARNWYKISIAKHPNAFPTDKLIAQEPPAKPKIQWNDLTDHIVKKTIIVCTKCNQSLRVPTNKTLNVTCTQCLHKFLVNT